MKNAILSIYAPTKKIAIPPKTIAMAAHPSDGIIPAIPTTIAIAIIPIIVVILFN